MMIKSKELLGLPLITIADAKGMGTIGGIVINPQEKSIDFLLLEREEGHDLQGIPFGMIEGIGDFAVTVTDDNFIFNILKVGLLKDLVEKNIRLVDSQIITIKGRYLGKIVEFSLNEEDGKIENIYYEDRDGKESSIEAKEIITIGQEVIIVVDHSSSMKTPLQNVSSEERRDEKKVEEKKEVVPKEIIEAKEEVQEERKEEVQEERKEEVQKEEKKEAVTQIPSPSKKVVLDEILNATIDDETPQEDVQEKGDSIDNMSSRRPVTEIITDPAQSIIERKRKELVGKTLIKDIKTEEGRLIAKADTVITHEIYDVIQGLGYEVFIEMATSIKD